MFKYAALISYVGTQYCGWQKQSGTNSGDAPSIQETLELALQKITGEKFAVVGSGRTDSGVHSVGQVAHFSLKKKEWDPLILQKGLNSLLPIDIRIQALRPVPINFHSQRSASHKQYSYYFQQGPCALPHLEPYSWWIRKPLNLPAIQQALNHLKGEHDFKPFQASGSKPGPTVRRILEVQVTLESIGIPGAPHLESALTGGAPFGLVRVRLVGTGFLKQMVRGISGTLLQVGEDRREPDCTRLILETLDRSLVGPTAPARALWQDQVWYPGLTF